MIRIRHAVAWLAMLTVIGSAAQADGGESRSLPSETVTLNHAAIVVDREEPSFVQYGAEDLAGYLKEWTGTEIPRLATADRTKAVQILLGTKAVSQVFPQLVSDSKLDNEAYLLKVISQKDITYVVATGATPQGTKVALGQLMKTIQAEGPSAVLPARLHVVGKPAFAKRGMHPNGWTLNYPYTFRNWREKDWQQYLDLLSYQGVNLFYLWPFIEIMPVPFSPEDRAYLEECRRVVEYAQKKHGMEVWIMQCTNRVASDRCDVADPRQRPYWRPTQQDLNPANPEHLKAILASREAMYQIVNNADGVCNIDSDPGFCPGSTPDEYVRVLQGCRAMLDRDNLHGPQTKLIHWMLWGWGRNGISKDGLAEHQRITLERVQHGLPEPLWLISGQFPEFLVICRDAGMIPKTLYLPYGTIECEPSYPGTKIQLQEIRDAFQGIQDKYPDLGGVMGNVQTPLLQFPTLFYFTALMSDLSYGDRSEKEVLREVSGYLYPDHQQLLADSFLALQEPDPDKIDPLAEQLRGLLQNGDLGRPGVFGRKLFPDARIVAQALVLQLELRSACERLIRDVTPATPGAKSEELVRDYFEAYLAWDTTHGWHELWGWGNQLPSDRRFRALFEALGKSLGGPEEIRAAFDRISQSLSAKYGTDAAEKGCVAPWRDAAVRAAKAAQH